MAKKKDSAKPDLKEIQKKIADSDAKIRKDRSEASKKRRVAAVESGISEYNAMLEIEEKRLKNDNLSDLDKNAIQKDINRIKKKLERLTK